MSAFAAGALRTMAYVDGFNLYYGLKSKGWKRYYWLDVWRLAENLMRHGQLIGVKYFTACVRANPPKEARQQAYLGALRAHRPEVEIIYVNQKTIRTSLLPNPVLKADGAKLTKPVEWQ